jgi:parallel beta-helix repeat protein
MNDNDGIYLDSFCLNNLITGNSISSNSDEGIYLHHDSFYNFIYRNNFLNNGENAYDEGENFWDDGKYGNFWSDYEDRYPDAKPKLFKPWMWDTPYEIPGGDNKDMCPLVRQWPNSVSIDLPRNKAIQTSPLLNFLENYPNLFLVIRQLLGV